MTIKQILAPVVLTGIINGGCVSEMPFRAPRDQARIEYLANRITWHDQEEDKEHFPRIDSGANTGKSYCDQKGMVPKNNVCTYLTKGNFFPYSSRCLK